MWKSLTLCRLNWLECLPMFDELTSKAIAICVEKRIPFVAYCMPEASAVSFFSDPMYNNVSQRLDGNKFVVGFFEGDDRVEINAVYDAAQTVENCWNIHQLREPEISPWLISTEYMQYVSQVHQLVNKLRHRGGKVVLSRAICGSAAEVDWVKVAAKYFETFPGTFRYIYYTPETGCWIGVSPEILLKYVAGDDCFETMSLAGTRKIETGIGAWDAKNVEEHEYVTDYISETLRGLGCKVDVAVAENIVFGCVEHLCNRIKAQVKDDMSLLDVVTQLSPTPAFAGYPKECSLRDIFRFEVHPRYCYGSYVALIDSKDFHAYVNMRCVHFNERDYCIYAGGGLTSKSVAREEWDETENKVSALKDIISNAL